MSLKMVVRRVLSLAAVGPWLVLAPMGCTGGGEPQLSDKPNIEVIQDMMESPSVESQDPVSLSEREKPGSRVAPEGTVAVVGPQPYLYKGDPAAAEKNLKNPLAGDLSEAVLVVGQRKYEIYCMVCHGQKGGGDGPVAAAYLKSGLPVPAMVTDKVRTMSDAGIYHIITDGRGVMGSYQSQIINSRDRWAIVQYIRKLQKDTKTATN
jgi:mono/diheme cytochrome c family protein